jgi:hypothetical protein
MASVPESDDTASYQPEEQDALSPQTFHRFPKLPPELRRQIWRHAFPDPREVNLNPPLGICTKENHGDRVFRCSCINEGCFPLPVTLHVNQESRQETLAHYRLITMEDEEVGESKLICFDPARDAPYFYLQDLIDFDDMSQIEYEDMIRVYLLEMCDEMWLNPFRAGNIKNSSWLDGVKVIDIRCWELEIRPDDAETLRFRSVEMLQNIDQVRLRFSPTSKTKERCYYPSCTGNNLKPSSIENTCVWKRTLCSALEKKAGEVSENGTIPHSPEVIMFCCRKIDCACDRCVSLE